MISEYLGFDSDYIILGLAGVVIILLILIIINMVQTGKLKKRYKVFMSGKTAKSLEFSGRPRSLQSFVFGYLFFYYPFCYDFYFPCKGTHFL